MRDSRTQGMAVRTSRRTVLRSLGVSGLIGAGAITTESDLVSATRHDSDNARSEQALTVTGERFYDFDGDGSVITQLHGTSDGGALVGGYRYQPDPSTELKDAVLMKVDANSVIEWRRVFDGYPGQSISAVYETSDGDCLFVGTTTQGDESQTNSWIGKVDPTGETVFEITRDRTGDDVATSIVETHSGEYVVGGNLTDPETDTTAPYVSKIHPDSEREWQRTFDGTPKRTVSDMITTNDGSILLAGDARGGDISFTDGWLLKLDQHGGPLWEMTTGGEHRDRISSILELSNGGYVFCGNTYSLSEYTYLVRVGKLTTAGEITADFTVNKADYCRGDSLIERRPGEVVVVVRTFSKGTRDQSTQLMTLDTGGSRITEEQQLWIEGMDQNLIGSIDAASDGTVFLGGKTTTDGDQTVYRPWLVRLNHGNGGGTFDPRVHGFGFDNWAGERGTGRDGNTFELATDHPSRSEIRNRIESEWTLQTPENVPDTLSRLVETELERRNISGGHCLGMVYAADAYHRSPDRLPEGVQSASEIPHPTGAFESTGELIRSYHHTQILHHERYWTQLAVGFDQLDNKAHLDATLGAIKATGTAPLTLCIDSGLFKQNVYHQVLAYGFGSGEAENTLDLYVYDPNDTADEYRSDSDEVNYAYDRPRRTLTVDADSGELIGSNRYDDFAYLDLRSNSQVDRLHDTSNDIQGLFGDVFFIGVTAPASFELELSDGTSVQSSSSLQSTNSDDSDEVIWSFETPSDDFDVEVDSDESTEYTLTVSCVSDGEETINTTYTGAIAADETHSFNARLSPESDSNGHIEREGDEGQSQSQSESVSGSDSESEPAHSQESGSSVESRVSNWGPLGALGTATLGIGAAWKYFSDPGSGED